MGIDDDEEPDPEASYNIERSTIEIGGPSLEHLKQVKRTHGQTILRTKTSKNLIQNAEYQRADQC